MSDLNGITPAYTKKILEHAFGIASTPFSTTRYLALFTTAPDVDAGTNVFTPGVEVSGGSYARQLLTVADWALSSSGASGYSQLTYIKSVAFPVATANWGSVVAWGIFDSLSGGTQICGGNLAASVNVQTADTFYIDATAVPISVRITNTAGNTRGFTQDYRNGLLNYFFGISSLYAAPASLKLHIGTGASSTSGGGSFGQVVAFADNYPPNGVFIDPTTETAVDADNKTWKVTVEKKFPVATAAWGSITSAGIHTVGGALIAVTSVPSTAIDLGERATFAANDIVVTMGS